MGEIDVKKMTKEQLIGIVKDQGKKIDDLEKKIEKTTDFIEGMKSARLKHEEEEDW